MNVLKYVYLLIVVFYEIIHVVGCYEEHDMWNNSIVRTAIRLQVQ